ncbi:hypothetical protein [Psychrobacter pygoscelis]|uniref:hypothetical protein n=1 Tax=Psychrobacter pygoscelis TaxID=2488563 RepID=UPI0013F49EAC|nr:hypothetical protein [Psychrobacter pygoscelis]
MSKDSAAIKQAITQVCHSHEITCLHAIESGSRAIRFVGCKKSIVFMSLPL